MITSGFAIASISLNSLILRSLRSGAASWMNWDLDAITARSVVKLSLPFFLGLPSRLSIEGHATLIAALSFASAVGDTS